MNDFFSIDFKDGPNGVECWVSEIFKKFKNKNMNIVICDIIEETQILDTMGQFIANFIASSIPDAGYLVKKSIEKLMKSKIGKKLVMKTIMKRFKKNYNKIPKNIRKMIQEPDLFEQSFMETYLELRKEFTSKEFPITSEFEDQIEESINEEQINEEQINEEQQGGFLMKLLYRGATKVGKKLGRITASGVGFIIKKAGIGDQLIIHIDPIASKAKLLTYTIHKMLAISYAILCILKKCP